MDNEWSNDRIDFLVSLFGGAARVRFSTSRNIAQVDLYCKDEVDRRLEDTLLRKGWKLTEEYRASMPAGVVGKRYRHTDINPQRHRRTQEQLLRFLEQVHPTKEIDVMMAELGEAHSR